MEALPTITCSASEATFLASLLGGEMLLGMVDPFPGWLTEEIHESWQQAQKALAERHYIAIEADGRIVVDTTVAALISTWASPVASFILTWTLDCLPSQTRYFHCAPFLAIEQHTLSESAYQLTALESTLTIFQRVIQTWRLTNQTVAPGTKTTLSYDVLTRAHATAQEAGVAAAEALLTEVGVEAVTARALSETLAQPLVNGALVALARRADAWDVCGLGILEGANGLWCLRSFKRHLENWVEVIPSDAAHARAEIHRVMNRALPEPLPVLETSVSFTADGEANFPS